LKRSSLFFLYIFMLVEPGYGVLFSPNEFCVILPAGLLILLNLDPHCKEA